MNFDSGRFHPAQTPKNQREIYFDALTKAAELGDRLMIQVQPAAAQYFYRISNPLTIETIKQELPIELQSVAALESIRFEFEDSEPDSRDTSMSTSAKLVLEFDNNYECHVSLPAIASPHESQYELVLSNVPGSSSDQKYDPTILTGVLSPAELSAVIARSIVPSQDPQLVDFSHIGDGRASEIRDMLENLEYVQKDKVYIYEYVGHTIVVSIQNENLRELSIEQTMLPTDDYSFSFRTTLDHGAHQQELYVCQYGIRSQHPINHADVAAFRDIIDELLSTLMPDDDSYEEHAATTVALEDGT